MDKARKRLSLLAAVGYYDPAPVTVDDMAKDPRVQALAIPRDEVAELLRHLAEHGYLTDLRPTSDPIYRLSSAGRDQLDGEAKRDEYIWGERAL